MSWRDAPVVSQGWQSAPPVEQSMDDRRRQLAQGATFQIATPFGRVDTGLGMPQGLTEGLAGAGRRFADIFTLGNRQALTGGEASQADAALDDSGYATAGGVAADLTTMVGGGGALRGAGTLARLGGAPSVSRGLRTAGRALMAPKNLKQAVAAGAAYGAATNSGDIVDRAGDALTGAAGGAIGRAVVAAPGAVSRALSPNVSPEVADLARRAEQLGIRVRADQLTDSKPLNAASAALDYVPFSGKTAAIETQQKQFNTALARTIGENTDNPAQAVVNARRRLGNEFDRVLKGNAVAFDQQLSNDLAQVAADASNEMSDAQFGIIAKQIAQLQQKAAGGQIDGQAAYNIKKQLDRLSNSSDSSLAFHAKGMRKALFDALNRSLGPEEAQAFAQTRQQYGNLFELERLVPAGAEGDISAARLAQAKTRIRSNDLSELSDIAGQFLKGRVGDSGTAQRAAYTGATVGGIPAMVMDPVITGSTLLGTAATGRTANALLGSQPIVRTLRDGAPMSVRAPINALANRSEEYLPYLLPLTNSLLINSR